MDTFLFVFGVCFALFCFCFSLLFLVSFVVAVVCCLFFVCLYIFNCLPSYCFTETIRKTKITGSKRIMESYILS